MYIECYTWLGNGSTFVRIVHFRAKPRYSIIASLWYSRGTVCVIVAVVIRFG